MIKLKKFVYPFFFSLCFFAVYFIVAILIGAFLPAGDYAGLAYAGNALVIWLAVILPIYCVRYTRVISGERRKYLFALYNPLVVVICHVGPFFKPFVSNGAADVITAIALMLFAYVALWTFLPTVMRSHPDK